MKGVIIICGLLVMMFTQSSLAQENNQSISEELKKVWEGDKGSGSASGSWLNMDGMYDTQAETNDTGEIGFADDVASTPIDGGLSLLLAAGVVAGARRIRREVNKTKEDKQSK